MCVSTSNVTTLQLIGGILFSDSVISVGFGSSFDNVFRHLEHKISKKEIRQRWRYSCAAVTIAKLRFIVYGRFCSLKFGLLRSVKEIGPRWHGGHCI